MFCEEGEVFLVFLVAGGVVPAVRAATTCVVQCNTVVKRHPEGGHCGSGQRAVAPGTCAVPGEGQEMRGVSEL